MTTSFKKKLHALTGLFGRSKSVKRPVADVKAATNTTTSVGKTESLEAVPKNIQDISAYLDRLITRAPLDGAYVKAFTSLFQSSGKSLRPERLQYCGEVEFKKNETKILDNEALVEASYNGRRWVQRGRVESKSFNIFKMTSEFDALAINYGYIALVDPVAMMTNFSDNIQKPLFKELCKKANEGVESSVKLFISFVATGTGNTSGSSRPTISVVMSVTSANVTTEYRCSTHYSTPRPQNEKV